MKVGTNHNDALAFSKANQKTWQNNTGRLGVAGRAQDRGRPLHHYEPVRLLGNTRIEKLPVSLDSWQPATI